MQLLKNYKGVDIYVTSEGEFYCNPNNNSKDYNQKIFHSEKFPSIEKAIDGFKNEITNGREVYEIIPYSNKFKLLKEVSNLGKISFFDDGSNSRNNNHLYLKSDLEGKLDRIMTYLANKKDLEEQAQNLMKSSREIGNQIDSILKTIPKFK